MGVSQPGIVTPEAVVLEFETAGLGSRLIARALDTALQGAALAAVLLGVFAAQATAATAITVAGFFLVFLVLFGYPIAMESLWRGRTLGKAAMGLRVVTVEGAPVRFRHAAIRAALALVDVYLLSGLIGVVAILASRRNQRLGDVVAGTLVLRERTGAAMPVATRFVAPAGLEGYAANLDVSALGPADYATVRSFLVRAPRIEPHARHQLASQLAAPIATRLHHQPPPGLAPEPFLACVVVAYQRRSAVPLDAPAPSPPWSPWSAWSPAPPPPLSTPAPAPAASSRPTDGFVPPA